LLLAVLKIMEDATIVYAAEAALRTQQRRCSATLA
jgi:hypothetical protein